MSGILPPWLQHLLGVEAAGRGEGVSWSIDSTWGWAPWQTVLLAAAAVGWVVWFYARESAACSRGYRALLAAFRLGLILIAVLMIAELMLSLRRTGLPTVVVLVDDSGSMGLVDRYDDAKIRAVVDQKLKVSGSQQASRLALAKGLLLDGPDPLLPGLDEEYKLSVYAVAAAAQPLEGDIQGLSAAVRKLEPTGEATRLGSAVRSVLSDLRGTPPAAIIVLSDGVTTDGESLSDAAKYARRKGVPLFTVGLGSEQPVRDVELSDLLVDEVVFVDDIVNFQFKLTGSGLAGQPVEIVLRQKGKPEVLARLKATLGSDGKPQRLQLPYRPTQVGDYEYVVEAEPVADEVQKENNRQERIVSVRKEQIRVLLVQAYPNNEFRYLKHMLERDGTIQLRTVLQEADVDYADLDQSALRVFPVRREDLFEYDVVIFGDVNPALLSSSVLGNLAAFVEEKGGGMALVCGPQYTPLAYRDTALEPLFPFELNTAVAPGARQPISEGFVVQPTDLGLSSPEMQLGDSLADTVRIWQNLPPMYWLLETPNLKPAARVLAEHPTRTTSEGRKLPVFTMQYFGAGKVLCHATEDTWRWRWRVGDVFFARYWVQAIRYLSRSKLLGKDRSAELVSERREYRRGDTVRLRARFIDERLAPAEDDGVTVVLERQGHPSQRIKLERAATNRGIFEASLPGLVDGKYHGWIATPTLEGQAPAADFLVTAPPGELERLQMDVAELREAADETRGHFYHLNEVSRLLSDLPPGRRVPIESLPPEVLWNRWWMLAAFLGLAVGEWILRKRKGML